MTALHPGPRNRITDVAGLRVGNATDARLKSGVTVLTADAPFVAAVDIRGGAPGHPRDRPARAGAAGVGGRRDRAVRRLGLRPRRPPAA